MRIGIMLALYVLPAVILFGTTMAVARAARWNVLLPIERGAWLLPGVLHAVLAPLIYRLDMSPPPKGVLNLIDPLLVAVLCWLAFVGRITLGVKRPRANRIAAYATIGLNMAIGIGVVFLVPPLPK